MKVFLLPIHTATRVMVPTSLLTITRLKEATTKNRILNFQMLLPYYLMKYSRDNNSITRRSILSKRHQEVKTEQLPRKY